MAVNPRDIVSGGKTPEDCNRLSFLVLLIVIQLQQCKGKVTLRSLFERLDEKKTGCITLNQMKNQLFREQGENASEDIIAINKAQIQALTQLMPKPEPEEGASPTAKGQKGQVFNYLPIVGISERLEITMGVRNAKLAVPCFL